MMRKLLRIVKDQTGEECAVPMVLSRKSTIWRRAIVKTLLRKRQMKYLNVEEMSVVTNVKYIAEQIKSDSTLSASIEQEGRECRDERTRSWKIWEGTKFEEHRDELSQEGKRRHGEERRDGWSQKKVENLENWKIVKMTKKR